MSQHTHRGELLRMGGPDHDLVRDQRGHGEDPRADMHVDRDLSAWAPRGLGIASDRKPISAPQPWVLQQSMSHRACGVVQSREVQGEKGPDTMSKLPYHHAEEALLAVDPVVSPRVVRCRLLATQRPARVRQ